MISSRHKRQANFFLSTNILETLKKQVALRKQSEFVEQAIEKELKRRSFLQAIDTSRGAWEEKEFNAEKFIRRLRKSKRS